MTILAGFFFLNSLWGEKVQLLALGKILSLSSFHVYDAPNVSRIILLILHHFLRRTSSVQYIPFSKWFIINAMVQIVRVDHTLLITEMRILCHFTIAKLLLEIHYNGI